MSSNGWYTKTDVIKDLKKTTRIKYFDVENAIIGERPPPRPKNYNDDAEELRSYERTTPGSMYNACEEPDVQGIYDMLRMVDKCNDTPSVTTNSTHRPVETSKNDILTITKLNPDSSEYVPTSVNNPSSSNDTSNENYLKISKSSDDGKIEGNSKNTVSYIYDKTQDYHVEASMAIGNCNVPEPELNAKGMRDKLKTKICNTSNSNCFKVKRERNLAIATLLKLYSTKTPVSSAAPIKLLTPHYFETHRASNTHNDKNAKKASEVNAIKEIIEDHEHNKYANIDADIKESVHKVTKWLETSNCIHDKNNDNLKFVQDDENEISRTHTELLKRSNETHRKFIKSNDKRPCIYLGPVTYKKKVISKSSPSLSPSNNTETPIPNKYIPSEYASELSKQYLENAKKVQEDKDIWAKLQDELEAKNEIMKQLLKEDLLRCTTPELEKISC